MAAGKQVVSIDNTQLTLSNMDKILYPEAKIVKAELIQYYLEVGKYFIDFAKNRPISMIRFPDGIDQTKFYSKNLPDYAPDFIKSRVYTDDGIAYPIVNSRPSLLWMVNMASLEIHADNLSFQGKNHFIDHVIFDLDPPSDYSYERLKKLSLSIINILNKYGMTPFIKTSGSKGVHIYVPIERIGYSQEFFDKLTNLAQRIVDEFPDECTMAFRKNKRSGKVFIDVLRNRVSQTCVLPFSTRALPGGPVSMPLSIEDFKKTESSQDYTIFNAPAYLAEKGNPWKDFHLSTSDFFGSSPKNKDETKNAQLPVGWFDTPSFTHQLASEITELNASMDDVIYENKWDGIRVFIYIKGRDVKILSRNNRDITHQFKDIASLFVPSLEKAEYVFDAELVSPDANGIPVFSQVISRLHQKSTSTPKYQAIAYVFDIIVNDGLVCTHLPWDKRRHQLEKAALSFSSIRLSEIYTDGQLLLDAVRNMNMEGIMVKKKSGKYALGQRTTDWLKLKIRHVTECVIIGFTEGSGDRSSLFGSLQIAELVEGKLIYRGRVGTGWDREGLKEIHTIISELETTTIRPFTEVTDDKDTTWLKQPYMNCEIKYASLTSNQTLREPVFMRLKETYYED